METPWRCGNDRLAEALRFLLGNVKAGVAESLGKGFFYEILRKSS
jgi:hypothetical protein